MNEERWVDAHGWRANVELVVCRTLGCTSPFARWFGWPLWVCDWTLNRLYPGWGVAEL